MHSADIAECFLSTVVQPERASAIVGDMVETSSLSISAVLRIAGAEMWNQTCQSPTRILAMAGTGFLAQIAGSGLAGLVLGLGLRAHGPLPPATVIGVFFLTQIFLGSHLARRAKQHLMAVFMALTVIDLATSSDWGYAVLWQTPILIGIVWQRRQGLRHA